MKTIYSLFTVLLLFFCLDAKSQNLQFRVPDSEIILNQDPFTELYSGRLQSTFLYDKTFPFINISKFDGTYDTTLKFNSWNQLYLDLYNSNLPESSFIMQPLAEFQNVKTKIYDAQNGHITPITILNLFYDQVKEDALDAKTLLLVDGKFYDAELEESPYETHRVFAAMPYTERLNSRNPVFNFDIEHYINNTQETIESITVDFGDGNGYVQVNFNENYTINYDEQGDSRDIYIKLLTSNNVELISHSIIQLPITSGYSEPNTIWQIQASIPFGSGNYNTIYGYGKAYIKYSNPNDPVLRKPIIIVEGLDTHDYNTTDLNSTHPQMGDFGWPQMYNQEPSRWPQMVQMPLLLNQLTADGFDIILLDFKNGADYIQRNAFVLVKLIQQINNVKAGNSPNIIMGASMGGQVARYALAYMEKNNMQHCTSEYISFDSPHKGANIALGLQHFLRFFKDKSSDAQKGHNALNMPAPQQLLVYHNNSNANTVRQQWVSALSTIGYPKLTRNVSVLNGSRTQQGIGFNAGAQLIDYNWQIPLLAYLRGDVWSLPGNSFGYIFIGKIPWGAEEAIALSGNFLNYDNAPGGTRGVAKQIADGNAEYGDIISTNDNQSFIPSISALDVNTTNLLYNISTINQDNPDKNITPFDAYFAPTSNENHVHVSGTITSGQMKWVYDEIKNTQVVAQPNLVSANFNYGRKITGYRTSNTLLSTNIGNLGNLYINGDLPLANGGTITDYPDNNSTFNVLTSGCSANIEVQSGGKIIVGATNPNNIGVLSIEKGSVLILKSNSRLVIHNNSRIIIKPGATFIFEPGAVIELVGNESVLKIEGQLEIKNNAIFTFIGNGHLSFATNNNVIMGSNSKVSLVGTGITDKVLEVTSGVAYFPYASGNSHEFSASNCAILTTYPNSILSVACDLNINNVSFSGNEGIRTYGQYPANILNSKFYSSNGIKAFQNNADGAPLYINNCDFIGADIGVDIYDKGFTIENSRFSEVTHSIKVQNIIFPSYISNVNIDVVPGYESYGIENEGVSYAPLIIDNVTINNVRYGVTVTNSTANIKCTYINSEYASVNILTNGVANFGTQNGGIFGANIFTRTTPTGQPVIKLTGADAIYLDEGKNEIKKDGLGSVYIDGDFMNFKTVTIYAENNKWYSCPTCPNALPNNNNFTVNNGTIDFDPYQTGYLSDQCGSISEMSIISDPGNNEVLDNCLECASISYKGKAINSYIKDLLREISLDSNEIYIIDHFNKLDSIFQFQYSGNNLNKIKKIEKLKNRIFENYMSKYSSLINKYNGNILEGIAFNKALINVNNRVNQSISFNDSAEIYKHIMSKAHILLTQNQYENALNTLNSLYPYVTINSKEFDLLERQICLISAEYNFSMNLFSISQLDSAISLCNSYKSSTQNSRSIIKNNEVINSSSKDINIIISPNPSNEIMNIELNSSNIDIVELSIIDITGRLIFKKSLELNGSTKVSINSKDYTPGIYNIIVNSKNNIISKKIILY